MCARSLLSLAPASSASSCGRPSSLSKACNINIIILAAQARLLFDVLSQHHVYFCLGPKGSSQYHVPVLQYFWRVRLAANLLKKRECARDNVKTLTNQVPILTTSQRRIRVQRPLIPVAAWRNLALGVVWVARMSSERAWALVVS